MIFWVFIKGKNGEDVWSCMDCDWIHIENIARQIFSELKDLGVKKPKDIKRLRGKIIEIKEKCFSNNF